MSYEYDNWPHRDTIKHYFNQNKNIYLMLKINVFGNDSNCKNLTTQDLVLTLFGNITSNYLK